MQDNEKNEKLLLTEALAKAQAEIRNATVNKENAFVGSKYADLGSVWDAIREPLTSNGLSITQTFEPDGDGILLFTILWHSSGQSITSVLPLIGVKDNHTLGSAATYARRYSLAAMVGCAPEGDDDDGNQAQTHGGKKTPARKTRMPKAKKAEDERTLSEKVEGILLQVPEADAWLRLKDVDPHDPPALVCERIVTLGADGLRKTIADDKKKQEKAEKEEDAAKIVDAADKAEPIEDEKEDEVAA
jgi:hypothetical protein